MLNVAIQYWFNIVIQTQMYIMFVLLCFSRPAGGNKEDLQCLWGADKCQTHIARAEDP